MHHRTTGGLVPQLSTASVYSVILFNSRLPSETKKAGVGGLLVLCQVSFPQLLQVTRHN